MVINGFGQPTVDNSQTEVAPWNVADLTTDALVLVWGVCFYLDGK